MLSINIREMRVTRFNDMALVSSAEGLMVDITLSNVGGVVLDFIDDDREDKFDCTRLEIV